MCHHCWWHSEKIINTYLQNILKIASARDLQLLYPPTQTKNTGVLYWGKNIPEKKNLEKDAHFVKFLLKSIDVS